MDDWMSITVSSTRESHAPRMAVVLQNERPACAGLSLQRMTVEQSMTSSRHPSGAHQRSLNATRTPLSSTISRPAIRSR